MDILSVLAIAPPFALQEAEQPSPPTPPQNIGRGWLSTDWPLRSSLIERKKKKRRKQETELIALRMI